MQKLDLFQSCLSSALDRRYFVDKWVRDHSLVQSLNQDYNWDFMNKNYLNKYINLVTPPPTNNKRLTDIQNLVGTIFFHTKEAKVLLNCRNDKTVYNCLSRRVNHFNLILNNEVNISTIVNKADKKDCELNPQQTTLMLHHRRSQNIKCDKTVFIYVSCCLLSCWSCRMSIHWCRR